MTDDPDDALANPEDATLSELIRALDDLPDDEARAWLETHSDVEADLQDQLKDMVDALSEVFGDLPDEYHERIQFDVDEGIYENARLETRDGVVVSLSSAYYWSTNSRGRHLVDVPADELPEHDLTEYRLQIDSDDGVPLLDGYIVDTGMEDGLDGKTTIIADPAPQDPGVE